MADKKGQEMNTEERREEVTGMKLYKTFPAEFSTRSSQVVVRPIGFIQQVILHIRKPYVNVAKQAISQ